MTKRNVWGHALTADRPGWRHSRPARTRLSGTAQRLGGRSTRPRSGSPPAPRWRWSPMTWRPRSRSANRGRRSPRRRQLPRPARQLSISPPAATPRPRRSYQDSLTSSRPTRRWCSSMRWSRSPGQERRRRVAMLADAQSMLDPADVGLALALAGTAQSTRSPCSNPPPGSRLPMPAHPPEPRARPCAWRGLGAGAQSSQRRILPPTRSKPAWPSGWQMARPGAVQRPGRRLHRRPAGRQRSRPAACGSRCQARQRRAPGRVAAPQPAPLQPRAHRSAAAGYGRGRRRRFRRRFCPGSRVAEGRPRSKPPAVRRRRQAALAPVVDALSPAAAPAAPSAAQDRRQGPRRRCRPPRPA